MVITWQEEIKHAAYTILIHQCCGTLVGVTITCKMETIADEAQNIMCLSKFLALFHKLFPENGGL